MRRVIVIYGFRCYIPVRVGGSICMLYCGKPYGELEKGKEYEGLCKEN